MCTKCGEESGETNGKCIAVTGNNKAFSVFGRTTALNDNDMYLIFSC
jgi:hypothetical protein